MTPTERVAQALLQGQPISDQAIAKRARLHVLKVREILNRLHDLHAAYQEGSDGPWLLTRKAERASARTR